MNELRAKTLLTIVSLVPLLCLMSCLKTGGGSDADDGNTPYVILDLKVVAFADSSITLSWSATGDDADVGTAAKYDLRYYREWVTPTNWDSATQVSGEPKPRPAGQADSMVVKGLKKDSTYYFALKAGDEADNWSGQSNCVSGTCYTDVVVTFPDQNFETCIRALISKSSGDIYRSDVMILTLLDANSKGIAALTGVESCSNLIAIFMSSNSVTDLGPLANLTNLRDLQFFGNGISNIAPLAGLVNLERVSLRLNAIVDITALSGLTKLHLLDLANNNISDLAPLVANTGFAARDSVSVEGNPLSQESLNSHIPTLEGRGVTVVH